MVARPMTALQRLSAINIPVISVLLYHSLYDDFALNEIMQISKLSVFDAYRLRHVYTSQTTVV